MGINSYSFGFDAKAPFQDTADVKQANAEKKAAEPKVADEVSTSSTRSVRRLSTATTEERVSTPLLDTARKVSNYLLKAVGIVRLIEAFQIKDQTSTYHPLSLALLMKMQMNFFSKGTADKLKQMSEDSQAEEKTKLEEKPTQSTDMPDSAEMELGDPGIKESLHIKVAQVGVEVAEKLAQAGVKAAYIGTTVLARVGFTAWAVAAVAYETIKSAVLIPRELINQEATTLTKIQLKLADDKANNQGVNRNKLLAKGVGMIFKQTLITWIQPLRIGFVALPSVFFMGDKQDKFLQNPTVKEAVRQTTPQHRRRGTVTATPFTPKQQESMKDLYATSRPRAGALTGAAIPKPESMVNPSAESAPAA